MVLKKIPDGIHHLHGLLAIDMMQGSGRSSDRKVWTPTSPIMAAKHHSCIPL